MHHAGGNPPPRRADQESRSEHMWAGHAGRSTSRKSITLVVGRTQSTAGSSDFGSRSVRARRRASVGEIEPVIVASSARDHSHTAVGRPGAQSFTAADGGRHAGVNERNTADRTSGPLCCVGVCSDRKTGRQLPVSTPRTVATPGVSRQREGLRSPKIGQSIHLAQTRPVIPPSHESAVKRDLMRRLVMSRIRSLTDAALGEFEAVPPERGAGVLERLGTGGGGAIAALVLYSVFVFGVHPVRESSD